jgi:hypothetical protein
MSITAKAMHMAVPTSIASHLRFLIFLSTGFFAIDVVSSFFTLCHQKPQHVSGSISQLIFKLLFGSSIQLSPCLIFYSQGSIRQQPGVQKSS